MSTLQAIQQQMLQAVIAERTSPIQTIRSDGIADAASRLDIYRKGYRIRLRDALKSEFAGLQCMVGQRFDTLLDKYIDAHPSEHYNIRWYGSGVAAFLDYTRPWRDKPHMTEMARLDWAISTAFDAANEPSVGIADLSSIPPDAWANLHLSLQENLQILACTHNTDAFRRAADGGAKRPRLHRFVRAHQIMVWRKAMTVHYRKLDDDEWQVLSAAMRGESFTALCETLAQYHDASTAMPRMVTLLQGWLETGLIRSLSAG